MASYLIHRPRRTLAALTAIVMLVATFIIFRGPAPAEATSGVSPYQVPVAVDVDPDPNVLETTITADENTVDIADGVMANALTFNGTVPGPELRVDAGDRIKVHLINNMDEPTGIHWHGIELANPMDGTPLTQNQVPAGGTFEYDFVAPRPGVYWYHPHHEFSTNQVFKGLYGSLIVTDPNEAELIADGVLPAADETLVLSDVTVCKDRDPNDDGEIADSLNDDQTYDTSLSWHWTGTTEGPGGPLPAQGGSPKAICETNPVDNHGAAFPAGYDAGDIPNIQRSSSPVREGQTVLTNGMNVGHSGGSPNSPDPATADSVKLPVQPGTGVRLQVINAAATRFFRLHMTDDLGANIPLVRVGGEGGLLNEAVLDGTDASFDFNYNEGEILIDPGDRVDVVAAFPSTATGVATLWTEDFPRQGSGDAQAGWPRLPSVPVAHFELTGVPALPAYTIDDGTDLRLATGDPVVELGAATGSPIDPAEFPAPQPLGTPAPGISFTSSPGPSIDGVHHHHDFSVDYTELANSASTRYALLGDTLELTITNSTVAHHPFHLHGFSMQPKTYVCTDPAQNFTFAPEYLDEIDVPPSCTLTFRILLEDRPFADGTPGGGLGRWVIHCHIFFHHHQGMESELVVVPPIVDITAPPSGSLYAVGSTVNVTADTFPDDSAPTFDWDDNGATDVGTGGGGVYSGSHTFTQAGVYTITATIDAGGITSSDSTMVVVYDPSAGFVTGGGTIDSPAGAYAPDPGLAGLANFGFVSKYKKGTSVPDGQTAFKLHFADFDFHSTAYNWLVVSGARAQYKGIGVINEAGNFGFLLTVVDGAVNGGGGVDKFRLKIWDKDNGDAIVYDNVAGASDDIDTANPQAIRSGSIVIHKGK